MPGAAVLDVVFDFEVGRYLIVCDQNHTRCSGRCRRYDFELTSRLQSEICGRVGRAEGSVFRKFGQAYIAIDRSVRLVELRDGCRSVGVAFIEDAITVHRLHFHDALEVRLVAAIFGPDLRRHLRGARFRFIESVAGVIVPELHDVGLAPFVHLRCVQLGVLVDQSDMGADAVFVAELALRQAHEGTKCFLGVFGAHLPDGFSLVVEEHYAQPRIEVRCVNPHGL
ncbi:hypothetical protein BOC44_20925 (plasmid) [Burkholderia pseudomallei]|nr:hypothetical protein BOC44_20925 [Burkholderia pseudomallei]